MIIVGAGFSGLGLGATLRRNGMRDFVILERALAIGGTWRDNTYPGVACDVPSQVYSYSFSQNPNWTRIFPHGEEIQAYLEHVARAEELSGHIRLGVDVQHMQWCSESQRWRCATSAGIYVAEILVVACGRLSEPNYPAVPGLAGFDAEGGRVTMHSARWRHDVDLREKRVVVVGSGASAIQLVPELAKLAGELAVLQRSAPYVVPRNDREYSATELRMHQRLPETMDEARRTWFWDQEKVYAQRALIHSSLEQARVRALAHLHQQVADPKLRQHLTPRYEIGCKRVLLSDTYYPTFSLPQVTLIDSPLARVESGTLIAEDGRAVEADVLVLATGFESSRQPYARRVRGVDGQSLADVWGDGMYAYNSTAVPGFPNMFIINGPNAGLGHNSAIVMIESQIAYIVQALSYLSELEVPVIEVTKHAAERFRDTIDELSRDTVWMRGGCESWYRHGGNGRLTLLWPGTAMGFRDALGRFDPEDYRSAGSFSGASRFEGFTRVVPGDEWRDVGPMKRSITQITAFNSASA